MLDITIQGVYLVLVFALVLAFWRLVLGPSLSDRVVALELMASIVVVMIGVHAIDTGISAYLDIAIVMALTSFIAAIGFARFIQERGAHSD